MQNYTVKEIGNICLRCLRANEDVKHFAEVFKYYQKENNTKKLEALANIFNQCFRVEREWDYNDSTDETKLRGYNVYVAVFPEMISATLEKQYQKITKLIFEENNSNSELQNSINELEC